MRAYLPEAREAWVVYTGGEKQMSSASEEGFFEALVEGAENICPYRIRISGHHGEVRESYDPYCFPPVLTDFDLHLMGEGTHYEKYERLGAHITEIQGVAGVNFAVWAPNAKGVSVVSDLNGWDGRRHPMRTRGASGIWELFIPGMQEGDLYKFEIKSEGELFIKADPYGFYSEVRPNTASIVWNLDKYQWQDEGWMRSRPDRNWLDAPISIYELHMGSWMRGEGDRFLTYREFADKLIAYVLRMHYTHIELLPIMEHPYDQSWGYQTLGYFSVTSRHGTPEDFMYFVDLCHQNGIGVIVDWVPAHFPKDAHGLAYFDGSFLYEHEHPFQREHRDWGTHIFNYGRNEVASFLLNSALFWLEKYHIDGLRVDAVASMLYLDYSRKEGEWIPNKYGGNENLEAIAFIKHFNRLCHERNPGVLTIAEESTAWPMVSRPTYAGGLGFSLKWNMGWMNDILSYFSKDAIYRKFHQYHLTFGLLYAFHENFILVLSHDEVVHGKRSLLDKMPGDTWQKFANLRLLFAFMFAHPGKKLMFMGGEIGQWNEWDSEHSLDWNLLEYEPHRKLQKFVEDLNAVYASTPEMYEVDFDYRGFEWVDFSDAESSVVSFIRRGKDPGRHVLFVFNFTPVLREGYRVGVPEMRGYREVFNSDSEFYGGSNKGNAGWVQAEERRLNQWQYSIEITLPPLGMLMFECQ